MLHDNQLSRYPVPDEFVGARNYAVPSYSDQIDGGVAIADNSLGLRFQIWKAEINMRAGRYYIDVSAPNTAPFVVYESLFFINEVNLAFDINMRYVVSFVENGEPKFKWYDPTDGGYVVTKIDGFVRNPRVGLDDSRRSQQGNADVILAYLRDGKLMYRQQRDRYTIERELTTGTYTALTRIGMGTNLRFQFQVS